ncbi:hypothetical protein EBS67_00435 [bacterium]|nr:hypothetical protein [bacterium]NBT60216.1 hypothetical protein [Planctomycetia bacterium]
MTINANPFPLQLRLVRDVLQEEPIKKAIPSRRPRLHAAIVEYFSGLVRNFPDKKISDRIISLAESNEYDRAHELTLKCGLTPVEYQDSRKFPVSEFKEKTQHKINQIDAEEEMYNKKSFGNTIAYKKSITDKDKSERLGTGSYPEDRNQIEDGYLRSPKTYSGMHPDHDLIIQYFKHFTSPLHRRIRKVIMHEAAIGEYGSAQRKLAKNNENLPPILDGLKFGEAQVNKIKQLASSGEDEE